MGVFDYINGLLGPKQQPSVMDGYEPPRRYIGGYINPEPPLTGPTIAGGLLSLDPTDYLGPQSLAKAATAIKGLLGGAVAKGGLLGAGLGVIKSSGNFPKNMIYPKEFSGQVVAPRIDALPPSNLYDRIGMFPVNAAATGDLRALSSGDLLATVTPQWLSKTKPFYAVGDDAAELIARAKQYAENSDRSVTAARVSKVPKDVRTSLENQFGNVFNYDISNASGSRSYYIVHTPTGTKIRVSDHDLPGHYEQPDIDLRPYEVGDIGNRLSEYISGIVK